MQVLILEDDPMRIADLVAGFGDKGLSVVALPSVSTAEIFLRSQVVDLVVAREILGGKLSHVVALLAEYRNPMVASLLMTDRAGAETDELFELLPSLGCVLATNSAAQLVVQMGCGLCSGSRVPIHNIQAPEPGQAARRKEIDALLATMEYRLSTEDGLGEAEVEPGNGVLADWIPAGREKPQKMPLPPVAACLPERAAPVEDAPVQDGPPAWLEIEPASEEPAPLAAEEQGEAPDFTPVWLNIADMALEAQPTPDTEAQDPLDSDPVREAPDMGLQDVFARHRAVLRAQRLADMANAAPREDVASTTMAG